MKVITCLPNKELHIHADRFSVYAGKVRLFVFYVSSAVPTKEKSDCDINTELIYTDEKSAIWTSKSNIWDKKEYKLEVVDGCFTFKLKIFGEGVPEEINFFSGDSTGSNFGVSGYTLFSMQERNHEGSKHLICDEPAEILPLRAAPPPYVFPFFNDFTSDNIGIGICAKAGEHNFQNFRFQAPKTGWNENKCYFTLPLDGYTKISGEWTSPFIWGGFAKSDIAILENYSQWQYKNLHFKKNISADNAPEWWKGPIFCGWGAQCDLAKKNPDKKAPDFAKQDIYTDFCERFNEFGLNPGIIMIDDKWQKDYGTLEPDNERWPDLRQFVDEQHVCGRHVLLWLKSWDKSGLDTDECITYQGLPYRADPTSDKYKERLKKQIYRLLSSDDGCFNCDGFKIDFFDNQPRFANAKSNKNGICGLELMKEMISAIYRYSKEAKNDALINASCCHPYFADCIDQFRIHDYDANVRSPLSTMQFRVETAKAVLPEILVDMDGFKGTTAFETLKILTEQPKLGVPSLYYFPDDFSVEERKILSNTWNEYTNKKSLG